MQNLSPVWIQRFLYLVDRPTSTNHLGQPSNWYQAYLNNKFEQLGERIMSAKNSRAAKSQNDWQVTFVQIKLDKGTADEFTEWFKRKPEQVALDIAAFISNGHKIGITWDNNNTCWIVSATCKEESSDNYNCCLSSRSDDWYEALAMTVFKNDVICKMGKWSDEQQSANWG